MQDRYKCVQVSFDRSDKRCQLRSGLGGRSERWTSYVLRTMRLVVMRMQGGAEKGQLKSSTMQEITSERK